MDQNQIQLLEQLLLKKLDGSITAEEQQVLNEWLQQSNARQALMDDLSNETWLSAQLAEMEAIPIPYQAPKPVRTVRLGRWAAAAAILLLMAGAAFWMNRSTQKTVEQPQQTAQLDVQPGHEGAILTLDDGSQLELDSLQNGKVAQQGSSSVILSNGQLQYDAGTASTGIQYNTIHTPRGRQFSLLLPDGSKVWLNSATTLRFPVAFNGESRTVEVSGEAYFEVARNDQQPFIVKANNKASFRVLGTSFNIKAHTDEQSITTTLITGKLAVEAANGQSILTPKQQANIAGTNLRIKDNVNIAEVTAWKDGLFSFDNKSLEEVMQELARWYDLEIVYEQGIPDITFGGAMSRNEPLTNVLQGLQDAKVKFRLEANRKLIVMP